MTVIDRKKEDSKVDTQALFKLTYGLQVLCAQKDGRDNGTVINTAWQVTETPHQLAVVVSKKSLTHDWVKETRRFTVSNLSERAEFSLIERFGMKSGRDTDKFDGFTGWERDKNGLPYLTEGTNAFFSAEVTQTIDLGTHTLFIARPTDMAILDDAASMTYAFYQEHLRPASKTPKPESKTVWRCVVCGYEYVGDELPPDFLCPLCNHGVNDFIRVEE